MADGTILLEVVVETDDATGEIKSMRQATERELERVERAARDAEDAVEDIGDAGSKAAAGVKKAGDAAGGASASVGRLATKTDGLKTGFSGAGEAISAATSATELFGTRGSSAVSSIGGAVASLVSSGLGPLGIGLALVTTATSLFAASMADVSQESAEAEARLKSLREETEKLRTERDLLAGGNAATTRRVEIAQLRKDIESEITFTLERGGQMSTTELFRRLAIGNFQGEGVSQMDRLRAISLQQMMSDPSADFAMEDEYLTERGRLMRDRIFELQQAEKLEREIDDMRQRMREEEKDRIERQFRELTGSGSGGAAGSSLPGGRLPPDSRSFGLDPSLRGDFLARAQAAGLPVSSLSFGRTARDEFLGLPGPGDGSSLLSSRFGVRSPEDVRRDRELFSAGAANGRGPASAATGGSAGASDAGKQVGEDFGKGFASTAVGGLRGGLVDFARGGEATDIGVQLGESLADGLIDALAGKLLESSGLEDALASAFDGIFGGPGGAPGGGGGSGASTTPGARE